MLWEHQIELARQAFEILRDKHIVYLVMEMRVGKTLIALETARLIGVRKILFVTKKKAIPSVLMDYQREGYAKHFQLDVTNYEQTHKFRSGYDLVVIDEAHLIGGFPKPTLRAKRLKRIVQDAYLILISGTPTPESYSQIFHQFWISDFSPFPHKNFYRWADEYVKVYTMQLNGVSVRKYEKANEEKIRAVISPYLVSYTRKQAGFEVTEVKEQILEVPMQEKTYRFVKELLRNRIFTFPDGEVVRVDNPSKTLWKVHQVYSGTIICESGSRKIIDTSKAKAIWRWFYGRKIAIFYKYISEFELLTKVFPNYTTDPQVFACSSNAILLLQVAAGSMGVDLSSAEAIVFYNIDFSATNYWQARSRLFHKDRKNDAKVYWVFAQNGIEKKIYSVVQKKKDYTARYFQKDFMFNKVKDLK